MEITPIRWTLLLAKEAYVLVFEIWCENVVSDLCKYLLAAPKPATIKLVVVGGDGSQESGLVNIYQFALAAALEDVAAKELRREGGYS